MKVFISYNHADQKSRTGCKTVKDLASRACAAGHVK